MNYQPILQAAIRALDFHSPTVFSWFGRASEDLHTQVKASLTSTNARRYLHHTLKMRLYQDFYCSGQPRPSSPDVTEPPAQRTPLAQALSQANQGEGYWSQDWQIQSNSSLAEPAVVVQRRGLSLQVAPHEYQPAIASNSETTKVAVRYPKEFWGMSPGHYMALSDVELCPKSLADLVRIYWNVTPEGAVPLMATITRMLNQAEIPFRFKVLNNPSQFISRCDVAVLYFDRENFRAIAELLQQSIYLEVAPYLEPGTPALTKILAPGIGLAEEPGNGKSFGLHRCGILADGLIQAHEQGLTDVGDRMVALNAHCRRMGLSLETPYLQVDSPDQYDVSLPQYNPQAVRQPLAIKPLSTQPDRFLETAKEIAEHICQDAIWDETQCTWLGAEADTLSRASSLSQLTHRALGPALYDGTSGIALFLAELSIIANHPTFRKTALGAIHHALDRLADCPEPFRRGFYSGWIGIAVVAARIGTLLDQPELLTAAADIVRRCAQEPIEPQPQFDLISGIAGGIKGLVILQALLPSEVGCGELAQRWGHELITQGQASRYGFSWGSPTQSGKTHLTGWSHGTSGAASALLDLYQITQNETFLQVAKQAFAYERYWFNPDLGNWPDLRQVNRRQHALPYMSAWCHGAPGIALARLEAFATLGDFLYHQEAISALKTTRDALVVGLKPGNAFNFSLCHGLTGNMEILLLGSEQLGDEVKDSRAIVEAIADEGRIRYGDNHQWPCGVHCQGETPNLMLGLAGMGHFYLRLYCSKIPSILMPQAAAFSHRIETVPAERTTTRKKVAA